MYYFLKIMSAIDLSPLPQLKSGADNNSAVLTIFNIFLAISGAVAVLIITIAGLKFTLANGDSQTIAKAKNSIIYAIAGLVIIMFAAAIANYVFERL